MMDVLTVLIQKRKNEKQIKHEVVGLHFAHEGLLLSSSLDVLACINREDYKKRIKGSSTK